MSPEPDAGWTTVCFPTEWTGGASRGDGSDGSEDRSFFVVRCPDPARGPALVRTHPLSSAVRWHARPPGCSHVPGPLPCDVHLWVDADSPRRTALREYADVLVSRLRLPPLPARHRVRELLADHPGCLAAAVADTTTRCVVGVRERTGAVWFVRPGQGKSDASLPPHALVSVVHAWLVSGGSSRALRRVAPMQPR